MTRTSWFLAYLITKLASEVTCNDVNERIYREILIILSTRFVATMVHDNLRILGLFLERC